LLTHEDLFLEVTPKKALHDLCGRKFVGKSRTKFSRASWGKSRKILRNPKNLLAPIPMRMIDISILCENFK